jgi:hypothetical protein
MGRKITAFFIWKEFVDEIQLRGTQVGTNLTQKEQRFGRYFLNWVTFELQPMSAN